MSEDYIRGFCKIVSAHGVSDTRLQKVAQVLRTTRVLGNPTLKLLNRLIRNPQGIRATRTFTYNGTPYTAGLTVGGIQAALRTEKASILQDVAHSRASRIRNRLLSLYRTSSGPSLPRIRPLQGAEFGDFRRASKLRELEQAHGLHPDLVMDGPFGKEPDTAYIDGFLRTLGVRK